MIDRYIIIMVNRHFKIVYDDRYFGEVFSKTPIDAATYALDMLVNVNNLKKKIYSSGVKFCIFELTDKKKFNYIGKRKQLCVSLKHKTGKITTYENNIIKYKS